MFEQDFTTWIIQHLEKPLKNLDVNQLQFFLHVRQIAKWQVLAFVSFV